MAATHCAGFVDARPWAESEFTDLLNAGAVAIGDATCFALMRVVLDEVELLTIATHPDFQRQGYARLVMADWMGQAQKRGAERAFLEVAADNAPAIALYRAFGFEVSGIRPGYYRRDDGRTCDGWVMQSALTAPPDAKFSTIGSKSG